MLTRDAAASFYDTLVRFLRLGLRTVLVFGLIVALAGFLTGRSITAVRTRAGLSRGIAWLRGGAEKAGFRTGPVGAWVYRYKRVLQFVTLGIAALVLVFWERPTGKVIIVLALAYSLCWRSSSSSGDRRARRWKCRCRRRGRGTRAGRCSAGEPRQSTSVTLRLIAPMRLRSILKDHP